MQNGFETQIITVSDLTKEIKFTLEENFSRISVIGEISNFKAHYSGHWYFNLKDSDAVINCTMWKGFNNLVFFTPQDGMKVIVNGKITVYPPRGNYQIDVRSIKPAGMGELQEAFEKLKAKLEADGLFDEDYKKPIPSFPKKIGIVTAIGSAALNDMISVAERRYPVVELIISPAKVQGSGAAEAIVKSIKKLNSLNDVDVIIISRGGGSIEDLWAFNEEIVARAIFNSKIPVISGVGHEIDFTIADYVADLRAPTPSVAMELATPNIDEIFAFINDFNYYTTQNLVSRISEIKSQTFSLINSYGFRTPSDLIRRRTQDIDFNLSNLVQKIDGKFLGKKHKLLLFKKAIELNDMNKTLKRGFVLVKQNSKFVTRAAQFDNQESADLQFADGSVKVKT
jgi:exodeoxyribonuclease VII large subunit